MRRIYCLVISLSVATPVLGQETRPAYEAAECPFEGAADIEGVECGVITVPERPDIHGGRTLRLVVAILRSRGPSSAPDPIVFLSGGPGGSSVEHMPGRANHPFWNRLRRERDLVFFDQRGTGYSEPAFCPELDRAFLATAYGGLSAADAERELVRAVAACREQMLAQGVDLTAYNSAASASDLSDLRKALGYDAWNLLGLSYGTRLALTALRDAPDGIRSVILDSSVPPDVAQWADAGERFSRSLRLAFDQCSADPDCRAAFPSLEEDFYQVIADLQANPIVLALPDTARFPDGQLVVDGKAWARGVFQGFYDRSFVPVFPLMVRESKRRNRDVLEALAEGIGLDQSQIRRGMNYSVDCYEKAPFNTPERIEEDRRRHARLASWLEAGPSHAVCDAWHGARADSTEFRPVRSDIPTLILAGEFDPITPPSYGRRVARTLPNATLVEVPAMGHAVSPFSDCTRDLIDAFLEAPERSLDTSCVAGLPPVSFVTNVHLNGGVRRLASALRGGGGALAGLGLLGIVLASAVVEWPIAALVRRLRGRPAEPGSRVQSAARPLAAVAAAFALVFVVGLVVAIRQTAARNPYVLAFGLPGEAAWPFAIPWAVAALTLAVVAFAVLAWRREWWTRVQRIHYSLVAVACVGFVAFVASWGLM